MRIAARARSELTAAPPSCTRRQEFATACCLRGVPPSAAARTPRGTRTSACRPHAGVEVLAQHARVTDRVHNALARAQSIQHPRRRRHDQRSRVGLTPRTNAGNASSSRSRSKRSARCPCAPCAVGPTISTCSAHAAGAGAADVRRQRDQGSLKTRPAFAATGFRGSLRSLRRRARRRRQTARGKLRAPSAPACARAAGGAVSSYAPLL